MTNQNDAATVWELVSAMQPAHTIQGFAINILAAIRAGKIPGIAHLTAPEAGLAIGMAREGLLNNPIPPNIIANDLTTN